tara:strand:- start:1144 stop:2385 length:1242 start_codon:yes stop_codon:yes gene_type:complete
MYDFRSKITIFFRNRQVKTGFKRDPSTKNIILISVVLSGFALSFLLLWILIRSTPSNEKTENILSRLPVENKQAIIKQGSITTTGTQTDKEIPKTIDPFPIIKNENVSKNEEVEVKTEAEVNDGGKKDNTVENTIAPPPTENQQEVPEQDFRAPTAIETDKKSLNKTELLQIVKEKEIEVKIEEEVREEKKDDEVSSDAAVATSHYIKIVANNVNIRTKPSPEADIIARLGHGFIVKKLDNQGDWVLTDTGVGFKGWIYYDLLEDTTADEYESWKNNPNRSAVIGIIRKDLDDPDNLEREKKKIEELLSAWKAAWEEKDIEKYLSFYSKAFTKASFNRESYKEYKKNIFDKPGIISLEIINVSIKWDNFFMIASFIQKYQSGPINSTTKKMLYFQQEIDGWKIVKEILIKRNT